MDIRSSWNNTTAAAIAVFGPLVLLFASCVEASPLFEDNAVIDISLKGPLAAMTQDVDERRERRFILAEEGVEQGVKLRVRGKSRVVQCRFPPLRINFRSVQSAGTRFAGQDKVDLVTHCRNSDKAEQDLLEEYVAYRVLNRLTDFSYRVRLLRIRYVDTEDEPTGAVVVRHGFLVEPDDHLAARVGAGFVERTGITRGALDPEHAALVFIFQYLIGNTDWSLVAPHGEEFCCHNGNLFALDSLLYLVPHDFDLSGLVNARYARPDASLPISRVTSRIYRGYCISPAALRAGLATIVQSRGAILEVLDELPLQTPRVVESRLRYLERFYERAGDEEALLENFQRLCI